MKAVQPELASQYDRWKELALINFRTKSGVVRTQATNQMPARKEYINGFTQNH